MKKVFYAMLAGSISLMLACSPEGANDSEEAEETSENDENGEAAEEEGEPGATVDLQDENEEPVGTVEFFESGDGNTLLTAEVENLDPGYHGFHIHEEGLCEPDADEGPFDTAEGHYAPEDNAHPEHAGDLPPLHVNEDETAMMSVEVDRFSPDELIEEETAMIVHEDPDNFAHIPDRYQSEDQDEPGSDEDTLDTGDAGDRLACGVIEAP
ncbi:superoxide dismutase family protein [Natribacillus halophilus]|uniref:Superoxide dismutase [Cu-Zn] n=1 Tax=Natribacillus halophilus TaxID=549003 RepID=A0A1G8LQQ3_9BACI|nr:superoxide dismutase family protein [Natribacillus halophilus]SDI57996.1 superoxide dismutase, Cu-Zn family [Natribacillus halophilus]